jgi:hypothetical protein
VVLAQADLGGQATLSRSTSFGINLTVSPIRDAAEIEHAAVAVSGERAYFVMQS